MTTLRKGKGSKAYCGLIYGMPGSGKTSLLANRKENFFIGTESNTEFDIVGFKESRTFNELLMSLELAPDEVRKNNCDTIVIDHISDVEKLCKESFCGQDRNLVTWGNGYGAGYQELEKRFGKLIRLSREIQDKGINVVFIGHAEEKTHKDIISETEQLIHRPALEKRVLNLVASYTDFIFHIHRKSQGSKGLVKPKRFLYTSYHETVYAKKRGGLNIPDELEIPEGNKDIWNKIHKDLIGEFGVVKESKDCLPMFNAKENIYIDLRKELSNYINTDKIPTIDSIKGDDSKVIKGIDYIQAMLTKLKLSKED